MTPDCPLFLPQLTFLNLLFVAKWLEGLVGAISTALYSQCDRLQIDVLSRSEKFTLIKQFNLSF